MDFTENMSKHARLWWWLTALACVVPLTAILHHRVFYTHTCMLNNFGPDYYPSVILKWLRGDPSFTLGLIASVAIGIAGRYLPLVRLLTLAFLLATIPLDIWVWDIPFTQRIVCHHFHDGHSVFRAWHMYGFALLSFPAFMLLGWRRGAAKAVSGT
jgi:hypothetical protein